jgi:hypothetical protein
VDENYLLFADHWPPPAMEAESMTKPGRMEARLSLVVLAVLVMAGVGVYLRQFRINPAVIALRPESQQAALSPVAEQAPLLDAAESGLLPFSPPERFGPDTLYEKIDGRADLYLASGFVSLASQRFAPDGASDKWVELSIYDMGAPENAFSVFSMQRRQDALADDRLPNAYRTENALFMVHGKFYLELIGTDAADSLQQAMGTLARRFVETHGGTIKAQAPAIGLLPPEGLQDGTLTLIAANAFGYEQLDRIYTAEYRIEGAVLTAFVSDRRSADAAASLAAGYRRTLLSYGANDVDTPILVKDAAVLMFFDTYEIVFSRGKYLAGIHEAGDVKAAETLAERLATHLERAVE